MTHSDINLKTLELMGWTNMGDDSNEAATHVYEIAPSQIIMFRKKNNESDSWAVWEPALDPAQAEIVAQKHGGQVSTEQLKDGFFFATLVTESRTFERRERTLALAYCMVALDYWANKQIAITFLLPWQSS